MLYFSNSVENACLHGALWELQLCLPRHAVFSVLLLFYGVSLHCLDRRLQGLQENMVQPGLQTALRNWGAHSTIPTGIAVAWDGLFLFLNYEMFNFEMSEYIKSYSFLVKKCWLLFFFGVVFWKFSFSDRKQCSALRRVIFHIRKENVSQKIQIQWKQGNIQPFFAPLLTLISTTHREFLNLKVFLWCLLQNEVLRCR